MATQIGQTLRSALLSVQQPLSTLNSKIVTPQRVWERNNGSLRGNLVEKPFLQGILRNAEPLLKTVSGAILNDLKAIPGFFERKIGTSTFGWWMSETHIAQMMLTTALTTLWKKRGNFEYDASDLDQLVDEAEHFLTATELKVKFRSPLVNFQMDGETLNLTENITIRQLTEAELAEVYSDGIYPGSLNGMELMHQYIVESSYIEKVGASNSDKIDEPARDILDRTVLALRTFKSGRVGCNRVILEPATFFPVVTNWRGYGDLLVPVGTYVLDHSETLSFQTHAQLILGLKESTLLAACRRLADAETRTNPQDTVLDATIGLEALLLPQIKSENRHRFSLHYANLFGTPEERYNAYKLARGIYDLRSEIAHGSPLSKSLVKVGNQKISLREAAKISTDMLRMAVRQFLPKSNEAPYAKAEFWERSYFGLTQP